MPRLEPSPQLLVLLAPAMLAPTFPVRALAQSNDITLSLGGTPSQSRSFRSPTTGATQTSADISLGANYGRRFLDAEVAELYGEIEFVALPNRGLTAATATVPQNYASLYVAPGLRLKVLPSARLSPSMSNPRNCRTARTQRISFLAAASSISVEVWTISCFGSLGYAERFAIFCRGIRI